VHGDRLLQLFHELNLQLDCSIAAIQKAVLVILTICAIVCEFLCSVFTNLRIVSDSEGMFLVSINSIVDACTVNAFKYAWISFGSTVKFDFTADLTGTGNRSEEVIK